MQSLKLEDILDLTQYERQRRAVREELMALKAKRRLPVNDFLTLLFENRRLVWYQVQEMVRAERMVEEEAIRGEIEAYSPLIPGPMQWKTTLYIEIPDEAQLKSVLPRLPGIENSFFARAGGLEVAAAGEEGRSREDYTSTVHYLTWDLSPEFAAALKRGEPLTIGTRHPFCPSAVRVGEALVRELVQEME